ncbi:hypothetical protein M3226_00965 [Neobacillus cucumis]|uniref:hypothetical protein n=1 Tax=Neobacillus cucumis TaxID=1740721 RepID=UPI0020406587|nr:hypothetical protein [Neobacillus cucumis]MCM3724273.1 hypothetical protein [Neobacillus cucumis]
MIQKFIEQLRNNEKNKVYGYLVALAFMALAIVLAILTPDFNTLIKTTIGLLILVSLFIGTYLNLFLDINPYYRGLFFSLISLLVGVLFIVIYPEINPNATFRTIGPVAMLILTASAKFIKLRYKK